MSILINFHFILVGVVIGLRGCGLLDMAAYWTSSEGGLSIYQCLYGAGAGAVVFPLVLGLNQVLVLKPLRISTRLSTLIAATVGGISVTSAALTSSYAVIQGYQLSGSLVPLPKRDNTDIIKLQSPDLIASTLVSVIVFKALGGRFSSVLPSHLSSPGAFARGWIPANSVQYGTPAEKNIIQAIGREHGCHSCGRQVKKYVADHQPPNKISQEMQRFYPQCEKCSVLQGGSLAGSKATSAALVQHSLSLRLYHLFLPIPFGLGLLKYYSPSQIKIVKEEETHQAIIVEEKKEEEADANVNKPVQLSKFVTSFPLLIIWNEVVSFFISLPPITQFHLTIWTFSIVAALGST